MRVGTECGLMMMSGAMPSSVTGMSLAAMMLATISLLPARFDSLSPTCSGRAKRSLTRMNTSSFAPRGRMTVSTIASSSPRYTMLRSTNAYFASAASWPRVILATRPTSTSPRRTMVPGGTAPSTSFSYDALGRRFLVVSASGVQNSSPFSSSTRSTLKNTPANMPRSTDPWLRIAESSMLSPPYDSSAAHALTPLGSTYWCVSVRMSGSSLFAWKKRFLSARYGKFMTYQPHVWRPWFVS